MGRQLPVPRCWRRSGLYHHHEHQEVKGGLELTAREPRVAALWTLLASFFNKSGTACCKAVSRRRMAAWKYSFTELCPTSPTRRRTRHVANGDPCPDSVVWASMFAWSSMPCAGAAFMMSSAAGLGNLSGGLSARSLGMSPRLATPPCLRAGR